MKSVLHTFLPEPRRVRHLMMLHRMACHWSKEIPCEIYFLRMEVDNLFQMRFVLLHPNKECFEAWRWKSDWASSQNSGDDQTKNSVFDKYNMLNNIVLTLKSVSRWVRRLWYSVGRSDVSFALRSCQNFFLFASFSRYCLMDTNSLI